MQITRVLQNSKVEFIYNSVAHLFTVAVLLLILIGLQVHANTSYLTKADVSEGIGLVSTHRYEVALHYYSTGTWPAPFEEKPEQFYGTAIESIGFDGEGGFHIHFNRDVGDASGKTLSIIAATSTNTAHGNLIWLCGYSNSPEGYQLETTSKTNLAPNLLSLACRKQANNKQTQSTVQSERI